MSQNMYRVGDYVYFEVYPSAPYLIRRIEELIKHPNGNVEAKVACFYRRRDLPLALLKIADQSERQSQILSRAKRSLLRGGVDDGPSTSAENDGVADGADGADDAATTTIASTINKPPSSKENGVEKEGKTESTGVVKPEPPADTSEKPEPEEGDPTPADADAQAAEETPGDAKEEATPKEKEEKEPPKKKLERSFGFAGLPLGADSLTEDQVHSLRQREIFLSRQVDTLPATQIRGKCTVVILNEVETCDMYLSREDAFFYSLVYDPSNQTLLADKGRIELGERCQAKIPPMMIGAEPAVAAVAEPIAAAADGVVEEQDRSTADSAMEVDENADATGTLAVPAPKDTEDSPPAAKRAKKQSVQVTDREAVVYHPYHALTDRDIDQFLIIARAVGTFSRALDASSSMKLPSLHMTASAASRDVTLLHAMALLHQANYDIGQATKYLVPPPSKQHYPLEADKATCHNTVSLGGPILCRDQLEEWSASEATLFEDALDKYGKDFHDIRVDCLPWKSIRDIVEYYYMWKTTARYAEMQKSKKEEQENKLKQVYIPAYNKANPNLVGPPNPTQEPVKSPVPCESCKTLESPQWFGWGPAHLQLRLCNDCWVVWKKRGGLKVAHEYEAYDLDGAAEMSSNQTQGAAGGRGTGSQSRSYPQQPRGGTTIRGVVDANGTPQHLNYSKYLSATQQQQATGAIGGYRPHHQPDQQSAKGRSAFYLCTTMPVRVVRRLAPKNVLNLRKAARTPFKSIGQKTVEAYYYNCGLNDVLKTARLVSKKGTLSQWVIESLQKLHAKNSPAFNGAALLAASNLATAARR